MEKLRPTTFMDEIRHAESRVHDLAAQVNALADRLVGTSPCNDGSPEEGPSAGLLDRAAYSARAILKTISTIEDDLRRIESALPPTAPAVPVTGRADGTRARTMSP